MSVEVPLYKYNNIFTVCVCCRAVPEPAIIEGQTVYGTRSANIAWQRPIFFGDNNTLNGAELDLQYFVSVGGSDVQLVLEETLNLTELQPGTGNNVSVSWLHCVAYFVCMTIIGFN